MSDDVTVMLVGDDPLARGGLEALMPDAVLVGRAVSTDADLAEVALGAEAEVVLWDGGGEVPSAGRIRELDLPVVVLVPDSERAGDALAAGAMGVLRRDVQPSQLEAALLAAREGLIAVDARMRDAMGAVPRLDEGPLEPLTPREQEVLELLAEGRSNREIAVALDISVHTAKFHVDRILAKLDASGRTDAVVRAVRLGVLRL